MFFIIALSYTCPPVWVGLGTLVCDGRLMVGILGGRLVGGIRWRDGWGDHIPVTTTCIGVYMYPNYILFLFKCLLYLIPFLQDRLIWEKSCT